MLRVHSSVFRALDQRLLEAHRIGIDAYGALVALFPDLALTIGELGERRNLSASGISRSVDRLERLGLVERQPNPDDGRSLLVALTPKGLERLRAAQRTHHATVREMLFAAPRRCRPRPARADLGEGDAGRRLERGLAAAGDEPFSNAEHNRLILTIATVEAEHDVNVTPLRVWFPHAA
jgi:DNA-binding MarR family transcriptional regulator